MSSPPAVTVSSDAEHEAAVSRAGDARLVVSCFWAPWHAPSVQLMAVADEAARDHPEALVLKVEAEKAPAVTQAMGVRSVPTFVFRRGAETLRTVEGADAPAFVQALAALAQRAAVPAVPDGPAPAAAAPSAEELEARLRALVSAAPVMVFMKGSPTEPRCGFSRRMVELLKEVDATYGYFDILTDNAVRQGLKTFGDDPLPTFPQVFAGGQLVGGLDICGEMHADGDLKEALAVKGAESKSDLNARIRGVMGSARNVLLMKGTPEAPQCGFSRRIVAMLGDAGVNFKSYNVLEDQALRSGAKEISNFPTFPQLYHKGELVGGLDIVSELLEDGDLDHLKDEE